MELQNKNAELSILMKDLAIQKAELQNLSLQIRKWNDNNADKKDLEARFIAKKEEIAALNNQIKKQRLQLLQSASITKKLYKLSEKVVANQKRPLLKEKDWKAVETLIKNIYPTIYELLSISKLTDKEIQCAYLSVFDFDTNREAILLDVQTDSINKYRSRVRQKLQITGQKMTLYDFLIGTTEQQIDYK